MGMRRVLWVALFFLPLGGPQTSLADPFVPNPDQQITLILPVEGQGYGIAGRLLVIYTTDDGKDCEAAIDGRRVRNYEDVRLAGFNLGVHTFTVNPVMHPEKAKRVSFSIVPSASLQDRDGRLLALMDLDRASADRLGLESFRVTAVNGRPVVPMAPTGPVAIHPSQNSELLVSAHATFDKAALQAAAGDQGIRSIALQVDVGGAPVSAVAALPSQPGAAPALPAHASPVPCPGIKDKFIFERTWGQSAEGLLLNPAGVAVDSVFGMVYVADRGHDEIKAYRLDGSFVMRWSVPASIHGLAVSPDGQRLYATFESLHVVHEYSALFVSEPIRIFGGFGSGDGQFNAPLGIAVDVAGDLFVVDSGNHRVQKLSPDGTFRLKWGSRGALDGQFESPSGIAVSSAGQIYVADTGNHRIERFDLQGVFHLKWGGFGTANGEFRSPVGVAVSRDGRVYVADNDNPRVQEFDGAGAFARAFGSFGTGDGQFQSPFGIAVDGDGKVYASDSLVGRVQKFEPDGVFLLAWGNAAGPASFLGPERIAQDGMGHVYVCDRLTHLIQHRGGHLNGLWDRIADYVRNGRQPGAP